MTIGNATNRQIVHQRLLNSVAPTNLAHAPLQHQKRSNRSFSGHLAHTSLCIAASFCFIIICWNFNPFAIRMSSTLAGIGLREPCNSTWRKNSCLVKLFFSTSSLTTASISFRFCCRICCGKQWNVTFFHTRISKKEMKKKRSLVIKLRSPLSLVHNTGWQSAKPPNQFPEIDLH